MHSINIQIQKQWNDVLVKNVLMTLLANISICEVHIHRGRDKEPYINFTIKCRSGIILWGKIKNELNHLTGFKNQTIVICTGKHGWKDYVLLQHFNKKVPLG